LNLTTLAILFHYNCRLSGKYPSLNGLALLHSRHKAQWNNNLSASLRLEY
jgi:hypothetical protein